MDIQLGFFFFFFHSKWHPLRSSSRTSFWSAGTYSNLCKNNSPGARRRRGRCRSRWMTCNTSSVLGKRESKRRQEVLFQYEFSGLPRQKCVRSQSLDSWASRKVTNEDAGVISANEALSSSQ